MRRNSTSSIGALHPIVFFVVVYGISLFLAFFVCRTIYYGVNEEASNATSYEQAPEQMITAIAYK